MSGKRALVVDDSRSARVILSRMLEGYGLEIDAAESAEQALEYLKESKPDVIFMDHLMPGMDGFETCRRLKRIKPVSIIMLTAKEDVEDRVKGLETGADDYMPKPFNFSELLARIQARVRNQFPYLLEVIELGPFSIDAMRKELRYQDKLLDLSPTEFELLKHLVLHHGHVLSKSVILDQVWGYDFGGEENIVEVYIRSLREKLGDREHRLIRTIRGAGYRVDVT